MEVGRINIPTYLYILAQDRNLKHQYGLKIILNKDFLNMVLEIREF